jgi:tetratricopeptide (TPR) repeat protein
MTPMLKCDAVADLALVERYLAHRLSAAEREEFEAHFLTCERCQQALALGAGIRAAWPRVRPRPARRWVLLGSGLGLAAAAGLAAIILFTPKRVPVELERLGAVVQAPIYLGIPVRAGPAGPADSLFASAMTDYVAERYAEAAAGLRTALSAGVDSAPAEFFLGASLLMTAHPAEAAASFGKVIAGGETPYLAEAHFYRAKALLRGGQAAAALADLRDAARLGGVIGGYARALSDSIARAPRR